MNWKVIVKYSLALYVSLIISGIPIGYLMADIDPSGVRIPDWLIVYKYFALFLISLMCFVILARKQDDRPFLHGLLIILIVNGISLIIDFLIFPEVDFFSFFLDLFLILFSLILGVGVTLLKRNIVHRERES